MDDEKKLHATLTFDRDQLLYDIENCCYIEGHIMEEGAEHQRHMTKDVGDDGNIDRVARQLDLRFAEAEEMLYPLSKHTVHTSEEGVPWNDMPGVPAQYRIDLMLPEGFSQTTVNLLERLVHDYLVSRVVADWMSITKGEKAETWLAKAAEAEAEIERIKNHRRGRQGSRPLFWP